MENIPFLDLVAGNRRHEATFFRQLKTLYRQSRFIGGASVEHFETEFARAIGVPHCVAVGSGTSALHLALIAAGVGPGDEVIVPAFTFPGTAWGILYQGAVPVFADVRLEDACLDPESVVRRITSKTKAIIAVHLFGHPAPMRALKKLARDYGLALIEDAAQAHGGSYRGATLGSLGDFGCFSFYPTKNLGALGDAGAITTRKKSLAERLRRLRDHGQHRRFEPEEVGFNTRMDALQAEFLRLKLPGLSGENQRRSAIAALYLGSLQGHPHLTPLVPSADGVSAWHAFVVRARNRKKFLQHLDRKKIGYQIYYPKTLPALKPFHAFAKPGTTPMAEELARTAVALPLYSGLKLEVAHQIMARLDFSE